MRNTSRLLDILDRMESGPIIDEEEYDMTFVPGILAELAKKYDISIPADAVLVSNDNALADRLWAAGLEMAERIGVFHQDSSRRAVWSADEIEKALALAPAEITVGEFPDEHTIRNRYPESPERITIKGGSVGTPTSEDLYIALHQSYAQEPLVDLLINATLETVQGREGRSRSPWELLMGWQEVEMVKTATRRAGRPGIGQGVVENAVTEIAELSASSSDAFGPRHWHHVAMVSEFKTNYSLMIKLAHTVKTSGFIHSFHNTIYGGIAGGREGTAIAIVGATILLQMAYMTSTHSVCPTHPFYGNTTHPERCRLRAILAVGSPFRFGSRYGERLSCRSLLSGHQDHHRQAGRQASSANRRP